MSYTEYLRRKEAAAPKVIDTTLRLDASSYTERVKFASSRVLNEVNLRTTEQVDVLPTVTTFAGSGLVNYNDGIGTAVGLNVANDITRDPSGLNFYIVTGAAIRKMVIATRQVTTFVGDGNLYGDVNAIGTAARLGNYCTICIDPLGNYMYLADYVYNKIKRIELTGASVGTVTTIAGSGVQGTNDGTGLTAQFYTPTSICIDPAGLNLYVVDYWRIRKVRISDAQVTTFAGSTQASGIDGLGTAARFFTPQSICIDPAGLNLYVTDDNDHRIRRIRISDAQVTTVAGTGTAGYLDAIGTAAQFNFPYTVAIDPAGLNLYIADGSNSRIRRIQLSTNNVTTLVGNGTSGYLDGIGTAAVISAYTPGITFDSTGLNMYIVESAPSLRMRQIVVPYTFFQQVIPINKLKTGGRIADASAFTQYTGGQAVGKEVQAGMPARRLLLNSNSAGSLTGCRIVPEPVPYNPAVGGVYTANMVPRDASQFTRDETACRELTGEPHNRNELGPSLFVDNTIVGVKNYNLPQNNSKTYIATKCTQCGNNGSQIGKTCTFCIGANHLHPVDKPANTRWGPRPKKSAQPIIVNQSPSDFHKVGAAMRKIPYVEKHHANPQIGHIVYPKTPYRIPRGTAAQLKINDPQRYPGTM